MGGRQEFKAFAERGWHVHRPASAWRRVFGANSSTVRSVPVCPMFLVLHHVVLDKTSRPGEGRREELPSGVEIYISSRAWQHAHASLSGESMLQQVLTPANQHHVLRHAGGSDIAPGSRLHADAWTFSSTAHHNRESERRPAKPNRL